MYTSSTLGKKSNMTDTDVNDLAAVVEEPEDASRGRCRAGGVGGLRARPTAAQHQRAPAAADPSVARKNDRRLSKPPGPLSTPDTDSDNSVISLSFIRESRNTSQLPRKR